MCSSSTCTVVWLIGFPIGTLPFIERSSWITWQQVKVVFSVGPYPLMSTFGPSTFSAFFT